MLTPKIAAVMSSLGSPIKGKPVNVDAPKPRAKTPTSPGLGAKMRAETSHSLEKMLKEGAFTTGLEALVKEARGQAPLRVAPVSTNHVLARNLLPQAHSPETHPLLSKVQPSSAPRPAARPAASWDAVHAGAQQERMFSGEQPIIQAPVHDPAKAMGVIGLPEARAVRGAAPPAGSGPAAPAAGGGNLPPVPGAPASGGGGGRGGMFGGRVGRTMGLMGLGAVGAGLYGLHHQNEEDRRQRSLVYAPLPGSVMP